MKPFSLFQIHLNCLFSSSLPRHSPFHPQVDQSLPWLNQQFPKAFPAFQNLPLDLESGVLGSSLPPLQAYQVNSDDSLRFFSKKVLEF